ncbi:coat protein [Dregea volubilis polerovirus 1]|nr:coat protein [Dregea volubilis polerovirus 1]
MVAARSRNARRTRRRTTAARRMALGPTRPRAQRRGRQRRNRRRPARGNNVPRTRGSGETFVFSKDDLAGSSSGYITFGPSLSDCPAFSAGILRAYHEYKITLVVLEFISEAASTISGSMAYELDPHCKSTSLSSKINKFKNTQNGRRVFSAALINGQKWLDSSEDQFRILYKGNGPSSTVGSFRITIRVATQSPK